MERRILAFIQFHRSEDNDGDDGDDGDDSDNDDDDNNDNDDDVDGDDDMTMMMTIAFHVANGEDTHTSTFHIYKVSSIFKHYVMHMTSVCGGLYRH